MHIFSFNWAGVVFANYQAARSFFSETLGLQPGLVNQKRQYCQFLLPSGQIVEMYNAEKRQSSPRFQYGGGFSLGFDVDDLPRARRQMQAQGVEFITGIETWHEEAWTLFRGPEGRILQIQSSSTPAETEGRGLLNFSWAGLVLQDFDRSAAFYSDVLGMPVQVRMPGVAAHIDIDYGQRLDLYGPDHPWSRFLPPVSIGFGVADFEAERIKLVEKGVQPIEMTGWEAEEEKAALFYGPEQTVFKIFER